MASCQMSCWCTSSFHGSSASCWRVQLAAWAKSPRSTQAVARRASALPGQMIHLLGRHHQPFLELGAAREAEAGKKGTLAQRQRGLTGSRRRGLDVVEVEP